MTTDLILTRDLSLPIPPMDLPPLFAQQTIAHVTDPGFGSLQKLYTAAGFPLTWPARMIDHGAIGVLIATDAEPAAAAFLIRKPFYIQEIRRTFDAGPQADYYFGDFVAPAFRGKGFQRAMIRARLALSRDAARQWAIALTRSTIATSLANYRAEAFRLTLELRKRTLLHWELEHRRRLIPDLPAGNLSDEGWAIPFGRIIRKSG